MGYKSIVFCRNNGWIMDNMDKDLYIMTLFKAILLSEGLQFCWCSGKSLITNIHKWIAICIKEHIAKLQHWSGILNNCGRINVLSLCTGY